MSCTINASTTTGLVESADLTGVIEIQNNGTTGLTLDSGTLKFNSGYGSVATAYGCRAWVNFNGTGTVAIRASGNVSSITDNGVGDYTVNFTNALVDANYSTVTACSRDPNGAFTTNIATNDATGGSVPPTTTAVRVTSNGGSGIGGKDVTYYSVSVFR